MEPTDLTTHSISVNSNYLFIYVLNVIYRSMCGIKCGRIRPKRKIGHIGAESLCRSRMRCGLMGIFKHAMSIGRNHDRTIWWMLNSMPSEQYITFLAHVTDLFLQPKKKKLLIPNCSALLFAKKNKKKKITKNAMNFSANNFSEFVFRLK